MKIKLIPPFLMLFAGAISSIIMFSLHYETEKMLLLLLGVMIGFYIIGSLIKLMLDIFDRQNEEKRQEEDTGKGAEPEDIEGQVSKED